MASLPRRMAHAALLVLASLAALPARGVAQESFTFRPARRYARAVPTPEAVLGYATGARFSEHRAVLQVVEAIAAASDRVERLTYGATAEGRDLVLAVVSAPANLARLGAILDGIRRLADPRLGDAAERRALVESLPVVVWLSFNVHGNEASGTEASLPLLYHLAAAEDDAVEALLERAVVVIDSCLNPDGRERYARWYHGVAGARPDPDPQSVEHDEPWPGGRVNHYYFDLNRDWAFLTQRETRARLAEFHRFQPQVHVDLHEMSHESSYFFFPSAPPLNDNFPRSVLRFGELFGRGNAAAFDLFGWTYYTGEAFDLYYPGYGDSWPTFNGAIGMTYEQAGHSGAGLAVLRRDGTLLTLADRAARHFTAALATVVTAAENRRALLERFARFFEEALWEGRNGPLKEFLLLPGDNQRQTHELVELLLLQGIEVEVASEPLEADRCHSYLAPPAAPPERRRFAEGTFVASLAQPKKHLLKALLEPRSPPSGNSFYDVSAWSLPLAFGVEAFVAETATTGRRQPVTEPPRRPGGVAPGEPRAGFVVGWDPLAAARFLESMHRAGIKVRTALSPFTLGDRAFGGGALFMPRAGNPENLAELVARAATETGVDVVPAATSLTEEGPDLGSDSLMPLEPVRLAVFAGDAIEPSSFGAVRFLCEELLGIPVTALPFAGVGRADLARYNVLVLPDARGFGSERDAVAARLEAWVRDGGTLIALGGASFQLAGRDGFLKGVESGPERDANGQDMPGAGEPKDERWKTLAELSELRREQNLPGTLFRASLDPGHRLAFGVPAELPVLLDSTRAFRAGGPGTRLGIFEKDAWLSGFASRENIEKLAGQAYLAEVPFGRGRAILFAGDPNFRGFMRGQTGLFLNAIYLFATPPRGGRYGSEGE